MHALKSWMMGKRRLLGAGLATALLCPLAWAQDPLGGAGAGAMQPPPVGDANATGTSAQADKPDVVVTLRDTITLQHPSRKNIKQITVSRPGVLADIKPIDPNSPNLWTAVAQSIGFTKVTLDVEGEQAYTLAIRVDPDIAYIRSLVSKTFPTSNLNIIPGSGTGTFIVTGWVESPEDVEPIRSFMLGFVPQRNPANLTLSIRIAGVQQVQLDVCLARVRRTTLRQMGFSFGQGGHDVIFGSAFNPATAVTAGNFSPVGQGSLSSILGGGSASGTNLHFGVLGDQKAFLGLLTALRQEDLAKILSNPTLTTMSGRQADFLVGGELPAITTGGGSSGGGGGGSSNIQFRQFGTRVSFLPVVLGDGKIRVQVQAEVSRPNASQTVNTPFFSAPAFDINSVQSTVEMESSQTFIIGGLIETERAGQTNKVPVLGDLPFFGAAFRQVNYTDRETELVVAVTVSLVDPLDKAQRPTTLPGQETRGPTDFELFMEGILEAPRGPRDPFPCKTYVPAFKLDAPFGEPMGYCDCGRRCNIGEKCGGCGKLFGGCGKGCGTECGSCGTGCGAPCGGCAAPCGGCGSATVIGATPIQPMPVQASPMQTLPAQQAKPMPAMPSGSVSKATMVVPAVKESSVSLLPPEPKMTIVPASAPAAPAAPEASAIPPLPEAAKVVPAK